MSPHRPNCSSASDDHEVFCAASFVLVRLGWTILGALASQGSRQPHIGRTGSARSAARHAPAKWHHFAALKGGSKSAFKSGVCDTFDVRSNEWIRTFGGNILAEIDVREHTLSKALQGSQWRMIFYRLFGVRVGKRVFVDRDVVLAGALKCML